MPEPIEYQKAIEDEDFHLSAMDEKDKRIAELERKVEYQEATIHTLCVEKGIDGAELENQEMRGCQLNLTICELEYKLEEYLTHHEVHHIDCEIASFEARKDNR